jgi:hypothetical protein
MKSSYPKVGVAPIYSIGPRMPKARQRNLAKRQLRVKGVYTGRLRIRLIRSIRGLLASKIPDPTDSGSAEPLLLITGGCCSFADNSIEQQEREVNV